MVDALRVAWLEVAIGAPVDRRLPWIAADALVQGLDSPSLRELAGAQPQALLDNRDLLVAAMEEMGQTLRSPRGAWIELAQHWTSAVAEGSIGPREGAGLLWSAWVELDAPAILSDFVALADDWDESPARRGEIEARIRAAARRLAAGASGALPS